MTSPCYTHSTDVQLSSNISTVAVSRYSCVSLTMNEHLLSVDVDSDCCAPPESI